MAMQSMRQRFFSIVKESGKIRFLSSQQVIDREKKCGGTNIYPLPVVISRGEGVYLWDMEGKRYLDFVAGLSTANQGHCHPRLVKVMKDQAGKLAHTSRAVYTEPTGELAEYLTKLLGWDRFLPMNTGVEGCDTALKLARRWGYRVKKVPRYKATIVFAKGNYWGRSLAAVSASTYPEYNADYGPYMPLFEKVPYNDPVALEQKFQADPNICAFMVEPIQAETVAVPTDGYLKRVRELCTNYNILMIADEVATGLGRTGTRLALDYEGIRPDILVLGKPLSGGMYPVSGILTDDQIMSCFEPGSHGSTYGGNPLGNKVALEAVKILEEENLTENARRLGKILKEEVKKLPNDIATEYRGRGLLAGLVINKELAKGWDICLKLRDAGLLSVPSEGQCIRIMPPLTITEEQFREGINILITVLKSYQ